MYYTPLSHFARKVRILLERYKLPYKLNNVGNVADSDIALFGHNPLMKIPTLVDGSTWVTDSDVISQYIVKTYDAEDRYDVLTFDWAKLNMRTVLNGIMQEEVKFLLAKRTGVPVEQYKYFDKMTKVIQGGLTWVNDNAKLFDASRVGYLEFHLLCLWDHLEYYNLLDTRTYPSLQEIILQLRKDVTLNKSSPLEIKKN